MPTDTPLALLPSDRQLSPGAKAGIGVSVSILFSFILLTIILYIRRLKSELRAAQEAAAGVPESVWRSHLSTTMAPAPIRRRSSRFGSRRSRRGGSVDEGDERGRSPPVSPLSPRGMREAAQASVDGVLKKKRGHVLSVVVERSEEEDLGPLVREPVPGQKEGLAEALELDGSATEVVELPTSVTPRTRSRERSLSLERVGFGGLGRARARSFGEGDGGGGGGKDRWA
ncbi:hypothetical protein EJ04DRAFT_556805 [Polyplosphaeria fusca]|uniref:Uncharacterized protein n=1 Tax=Polyplosphaeria fusca TaxID=682080 RepID=A0A9P4QL77_9PLEO|nr:hypothetical protein EJ04DRAFT_556805 [Polyplosphaeria fusca]